MIKVTKPQKGEVTLTLPYEEAEVLLRGVGMVNYGSLKATAPVLAEAMEALLAEFGRNTTTEANEYIATIRAGQVYVEHLMEF